MTEGVIQEINNYKRQRDMSKVLEKRWLSMYLQLLDFKKNYGHVDVPAKFKLSTSLGYWVRRQRLVYNDGKIDPLRERLLLLIGFNFRLLKFHDWQQMFKRLGQFKEQYGHTHVTETYKDSQLHNWLVYQRKLYWKGKLHHSKIELLKNYGVDMKNKTINRWDDKFAKLVEFKKEHGHLLVCESYGADRRLINFVKGLRRTKGKISKLRRNELEKLGFDWNPEQTVTTMLNKERASKQWLQRFEELRAYKNRFGTTYIATTSKSHKSLAIWVCAQRNSVDKLAKEQIQLLERINFFDDQEANSYRNRKNRIMNL